MTANTRATRGNLSIRRETVSSESDIEALIQLMSDGFGDEASSNRHALLPNITPAQYHRARCMEHIGPALINGEIWAVYEGDARLGLAIWYPPGKTMSDTPEQKKYAEAPRTMIPPHEAAWRQSMVEARKAELSQDLPHFERDTFYLDVLVTIPEARGKGVGGALLAEVNGQARAQGKTTTLLTVTEPNRRFYRKQGFETIWERETVYPDGTTEPLIIMEYSKA